MVNRTHIRPREVGFTLIELLVVLAILAMLAAIVSPRYFHGIDRAREASLRTSLATMRDAIDKFDGDLGHYPGSLDELVQRHYIREVPIDPMTGRRDTWIIVSPPADAVSADGVADVRSGASGVGLDGAPFESY